MPKTKDFDERVRDLFIQLLRMYDVPERCSDSVIAYIDGVKMGAKVCEANTQHKDFKNNVAAGTRN